MKESSDFLYLRHSAAVLIFDIFLLLGSVQSVELKWLTANQK